MDESLVQHLVVEACKLGARGYQVIGWEPPRSSSDDSRGRLLHVRPAPPSSASQPMWYER